MVKNIIQFDVTNKFESESILRKKTEIVKNFGAKNVKECIINLNQTLDELILKYGKTRGIGLSAPQIGYNLSISVVEFDENRYIIINPKFINKSRNKRLFRIGCFSLYEYRALIKYYEKVTIKYYNQYGKEKTLEVNGDWAVIVQHEIDHLSGLLLFDKLPNKKRDLFIPREKKYITNYVPFKNYGFIMELKRRMGFRKSQTTTQYYSFLFSDSYDYNEYVEKAVAKRKKLIDVILKYNNIGDKILEAGCGTSSLSIYLSKLGFKLNCIDNDEDMLLLAKKINKKLNGSVKYYKQDITKQKFEDKEFKTIYSHGVLEHLDKVALINAIEEGFRVAKYYVVSVPTIWDISNNLMGDERLPTINHWKRLFKKQGYSILEVVKAFTMNSSFEKINNVFKIMPSDNVIFVLKSNNR